MRCAMAVGTAVLLLAGCGAPVRVLVDGAPIDVAELMRRFPLEPTANLRADPIGRTQGASLHVVQIRGGEAPHRHLAHDLVVTLVRGEGTLTLAGTRHPLAAGDVAVVPRGTSHWFVRSGCQPAVAVATFVPPLDAPDVVLDGGVDSAGATR